MFRFGKSISVAYQLIYVIALGSRSNCLPASTPKRVKFVGGRHADVPVAKDRRCPASNANVSRKRQLCAGTKRHDVL